MIVIAAAFVAVAAEASLRHGRGLYPKNHRSVYGTAPAATLSFNSDGKLKVLQFADMVR